MGNGFIISIFSPTGGQGVSFLTCQLAFRLREFGQSCVVDLNQYFGALNIYLNSPINMPPEAGKEACTPMSKEDFESIRSGSASLYSCAWKYNDAFFVVGAPPLAVAVDSMGSDYVATMVEACRNEFHCTILDLPHALAAEEVKTAMELSDLVIVVGDLAAAGALCKFARLTSEGEFANIAPKVAYVLNQVWSPAFSILILLNLPKLLRQLSIKNRGRAKLAKQQIQILHELPHDRKSVRWALNQGEMLTDASQLSQQLNILSNKIHERLMQRT